MMQLYHIHFLNFLCNKCNFCMLMTFLKLHSTESELLSAKLEVCILRMRLEWIPTSLCS